jgi:Zn-dependent M28 family amino/carboxypeptidase
MKKLRQADKKPGWGMVGGLGAAAALLAWQGLAIMRMPGRSWSGPLPPLSGEEAAIADNLRRLVHKFASEIGERNFSRPAALQAAADAIIEALRRQGYAPATQTLAVQGVAQHNIEAAIRGAVHPEEILVLGAHYDTVRHCPGANDNGSGIAALLEIARLCAGRPLARSVRFVFFFNEEEHGPGPPGSRLYAQACRERGEKIIGMISLETLGFYTDAPGSQRYPVPFGLFYPSTGNFVGFVGNSASRAFIRQAIAAFRAHARFPSRGGAAPAIFRDIFRSDQASFWRAGYPGLMVTDTANFRYAYYHTPGDSADKLNYDSTARVTAGLARMVAALADQRS